VCGCVCAHTCSVSACVCVCVCVCVHVVYHGFHCYCATAPEHPLLQGIEPVIRTYNTLMIACNSSNQWQESLRVYQQVWWGSPVRRDLVPACHAGERMQRIVMAHLDCVTSPAGLGWPVPTCMAQQHCHMTARQKCMFERLGRRSLAGWPISGYAPLRLGERMNFCAFSGVLARLA